MRRLSKRESILALIVVAALFLFLLKSFVFDSVLERLKITYQEIQRTTLQIERYLELERDKNTILTKYKGIERYLKLKGSDEEINAHLLREIEAIARGVGLAIEDMKPEGKPQINPSSKVYKIQLRAEGDIKTIMDFIYQLETTDILFKISNITLSSEARVTQLLKAEMEVLGILIS